MVNENRKTVPMMLQEFRIQKPDPKFQIFLLQRKNAHLKNKLKMLGNPFNRTKDGKTYLQRNFESFNDWLFCFLDVVHSAELAERVRSITELFRIRDKIQDFLDAELVLPTNKKRLESPEQLKKTLDQFFKA